MITYEEMKAIMKFCDEHDINYEFTNYYGFGSDEKIVGHALTIEAYLETTDLDEEDLKYNA